VLLLPTVQEPKPPAAVIVTSCNKGGRAPVIKVLKFLREYVSTSLIQMTEEFTGETNPLTLVKSDYVPVPGSEYNAKLYNRTNTPLPVGAARLFGTAEGRRSMRLMQRDVGATFGQSICIKAFADGLPRPAGYCFESAIGWRRLFEECECKLPEFAAAMEERYKGKKMPLARTVARAVFGVCVDVGRSRSRSRRRSSATESEESENKQDKEGKEEEEEKKY